MKTLALPLFALLALVLPADLPAAAPTLAQVDAWKAEFPAASPGDSVKLGQMIAGYQQHVNQVTPTAKKIISLLRDKLIRDQMTAKNILHPPKPNPRITAAMRTEAEEISRWLNGKFAPYLARAPL